MPATQLSSQSPITDRNCGILLCIGAVLLASALYLGLAKGGSALLFFVILGGSIAAFAMVLVILRKSRALRLRASGKSESQSAAKSDPKHEPETAPELNAKPEINMDAKPMLIVETVDETKKGHDSEAKPLSTREIKAEAAGVSSTDDPAVAHADADCSNNSGIALLMNTTLGELLLTTLLQDPEGAGRYVTHAILHAQASSSSTRPV